MTLIVRITRDERKGVTGIVERVRTGEKHRVRGLRAIGVLITRLATDEWAAAPGRLAPSREVRRGR